MKSTAGPGYCLKAAHSLTKGAQDLPIPDIDTEPASASLTELHRIRRAFWRLLLYSDVFREPNPKYPIIHKEQYLHAPMDVLGRY